MSTEAQPTAATGMDRPWVRRLTVAALVLSAAVLYIYRLGDHPPGLFCDEASMGYNSYCIAEAGISEDGEPWPLMFWSFAAYSYPIYIYPGALIVKLFGLTELATRLPAALYGAASVGVIFFLARSLAGYWIGLWTAVFLAFMPWHIHFSRIAFGMTAFSLIFLITLYLLLEYTRGRRTLPMAAFTAALSSYAYAVATVFVPLFVAGFGVLYFPTLIRRWKESLLALVVGVACIYPYARFYQTHERAWSYGRNIRWFQIEVPETGSLAARAESVVQQSIEQWPRFDEFYRKFVSDEFLLLRGDPITRHAVRDHGELLPMWIDVGRTIELPVLGTITNGTRISVFKLLVVLGILICLLWPDRRPKLILLWLLLFPVAAALIREAPSATRAFVGTGALAILAALGLGGLLRACRSILRIEPLVVAAQVALSVAFVATLLVPGVRQYLHLYFDVYPTYAAPGPGGFQYGYRQAIQYMESLRDQYDILAISTTDTNQPPIFAMFYRPLDPRAGRTLADLGYQIIDPAHYVAYDIDKRVLFALQRRDLRYFTDYEIKKTIVAPGGQEAFLVTEVRKRKKILDQWLTLGPFANQDKNGINRQIIPSDRFSMKTLENADGERVTWRSIRQIFVRTNLNEFYGITSPGAGPTHNPELVCAYALTNLISEQDQEAHFEIGGTDIVRAWINGDPLTTGPMPLTEQPRRRKIELKKGDNPLLVQSCEDIGHWYFEARITDANGMDLQNVRCSASLPAPPTPAAIEGDEAQPQPSSTELQLVQGFAGVLTFQHNQDDFADYRGASRSWWASSRDADPSVIWRTAPLPSKQRSAVVFTGSIGASPSPAEVWVDGEHVIDFAIDERIGSTTWQKGDWQLRFIQRQYGPGNSGYFILLVPERVVRPGEPLEIRVGIPAGQQDSWFMVKDYPDTIAHEALSSDAILKGDASEWEAVGDVVDESQ